MAQPMDMKPTLAKHGLLPRLSFLKRHRVFLVEPEYRLHQPARDIGSCYWQYDVHQRVRQSESERVE